MVRQKLVTLYQTFPNFSLKHTHNTNLSAPETSVNDPLGSKRTEFSLQDMEVVGSNIAKPYRTILRDFLKFTRKSGSPRTRWRKWLSCCTSAQSLH